MDRHSVTPPETLAEQYHALLEVTESISTHHDLAELFRDLARRLPRIIQCSSIAMALHDSGRNVMRLHILEALRPGPVSPGLEYPVEDVPGGWVWQHQQPFLCTDVEQEMRFPKVMPMVRASGIRSFCMVPLTTARRRLGALGVGSQKEQRYERGRVEFLQQVSKQVAVAVDNVLHHQDLTRDRDRLRLLLEVSESIALHRDLEDLFRDLATRLPHVVPFDYINAVLHESAGDVMRLRLLVTSQPSTISPGLELPVDESPGGLVWKTQRPLIVNDIAQEHRFPKLTERLRENGVQSFCVVPLTTAQRRLERYVTLN